MNVVIASNNQHKIREIKAVLGTKFDNIYTLSELGILCDPEENGSTFEENAIIKAKAIAQHTNMAVLADDTGLCVHALDNQPGIYSARYSGNHDDQSNRDKLLTNLLPYTNRTAHFETVVALLYPNGDIVTANGQVNGSILLREEGNTAFGYDCIFYCDDLGKSFGIATDAEKNTVSHRARALQQLLLQL